MVRIAHLSDLHFGAADPQALAALKDSVSAVSPDLAVVTGDLTQAGRKREFAEAAEFFRDFPIRLLILPGNHDAPVYSLALRFTNPWRRFREAFSAETDTAIDLPGATIVGLNSARRADMSLDWSRGRLSSSQIRFAEEALQKSPPYAVRIVALHHPVSLGPGRAGEAVVGRADKALSAFARADADLILTGHVHVADATVENRGDRSMIIARAGTASSTRQRGEAPSFNLVDAGDEQVTVHIHAFSDKGYPSIGVRKFLKVENGWRQTPD